jgi:hypothetical protein
MTDDWLQMNLVKPSVANPFLQTENFADAWTDEQYTNFRDKIHTYREWIDEAYDEQDRAESIAKWRRVFGDDFAAGVVLDEGKSVSKAVVASVRQSLVEARQFTGDLVEAIKRFGGRILPASFNRKSYMGGSALEARSRQSANVGHYPRRPAQEQVRHASRGSRLFTEPSPAGVLATLQGIDQYGYALRGRIHGDVARDEHGRSGGK